MLALIAGTGALPLALVARLPQPPLVCALRGFEPDLPVDVSFRLEQLGSFLADIKARGVNQVCMAGAVRRPMIDPDQIDAATLPLVPRVHAALASGDDRALRVIISILEEAGLTVVAAHEIAPDLLPNSGVLTKVAPAPHHNLEAERAEAEVAAMGAADIGQACIMHMGAVVAQEDAAGTDALLARAPAGALLFKAPKPQQDWRADLPLIGPGTAMAAAKAGLAGIIVEAGGVMLLDPETSIEILDSHGIFLWVRPKGAA